MKPRKPLIPGEIISCNDFYDYEAKYIADSKLQIPADLDEDTTNRLREIAVKAYGAWGCSRDGKSGLLCH